MIRIPVYQPSLGGNEKKYVSECLDSSWISSKGRFVQQFEARFAQFVGTTHAASTCNGTAALHVALEALGVTEGDEVIVPTLTYIASVNSIVYTRATPVFADSTRETWQLDPDAIRRSISERTRAIMAVHLYGHPCDMDAIMKIAQEHRLFVVEDCAEAIGTRYRGRHVGSFGNIAAFSFYGNKTITTGEGGMVVTGDKTLSERVRRLKGQGLADHREYWHDIVGFNYRMTNVQAAIGLAQLERVDEFVARKRAIALRYSALLQGLPLRLHEEAQGAQHSYWMVSILVERQDDREPLREFLRDAGIETRPLFHPVHTMPMYAKHFRRFPVAEDLAWRGINLPSYPGLDDDQVALVASTIRAYFERASR